MTGTKSAWNFWNFLTHGLDINQIPKAMPELLQGQPLNGSSPRTGFWKLVFTRRFPGIFLNQWLHGETSRSGQTEEASLRLTFTFHKNG
nr:uncharacterized protein LOC118879113 isoform X2 [Drosophila suzukii]XP_036677990.1 uncharacterized protein LOC118879113 isoform X3 [Drosophila suzukii]XP_036678152.1 uncharacterized protein LOC118879393 isoform X2 [Drosophila suzukii]XP_036678153.1 uncharacterized protein LOC118879393 isoform X3 [Drosophila suzukii]